jgi:hypothetical protein
MRQRHIAVMSLLALTATLGLTPGCADMLPPGAKVSVNDAQTGKGALKVTVKGDFSQLKTLATTAEVGEVIVEVDPASGINQTVSLSAAQLADGGEASFSSIAVGDATVTVTAHDTEDRVIGSASKTVTIVSNQTATADITVKLEDTVTYTPEPTPTPFPAPGDLNAAIAITNGDLVTLSTPAPTIMGAFAELGESFRLASPIDSAGVAATASAVYVVGGVDEETGISDRVQKAAVSQTGVIGTLETMNATLQEARRGALALVSGNSLYVLSGIGSGGTSLKTIERADLNGSGVPGSFNYQSPMLEGHTFGQAVRIGNYLYVLGGVDETGSATNTVERAVINSDDTLGTFVEVGSMNGVRQGHLAVVTGNYLYVLGGKNAGGSTVNSVERAPIYVDGTIGAFETVVSAFLTEGRAFHLGGLIGNKLYVVSGTDGTDARMTSVEAATVTDGVVGSFSVVDGVTTTKAREKASGMFLGKYFYLFGGYVTGGRVDTIERAEMTSAL